MKNTDIQSLLERYREGTLSDSELADLNRLAGRDEVMAAADSRASGILRRRRTVLFTVAGLHLAGTAVWTLLPRQDGTLIAETVVPEAVTLPEPVVEQATPTEQPASAIPTRPAQTQPTQVAQLRTPDTEHRAVPTDRPTPQNSEIKTQTSEETVVICNNQCEADSVINDIWKFLTV